VRRDADDVLRRTLHDHHAHRAVVREFATFAELVLAKSGELASSGSAG
jgi:hypothetical protein